MKRLLHAITLVVIVTTILAGGAAAQNNGQANHGSGQDRQGYCLVAPDKYEPCSPGTNGTEPQQSRGNFLYGEPGVDRHASPEPGNGPGCTAASALNTNPSQAAGDNFALPNQDHAAEPAAGGGPYYHCFG